MYRSIHHPKLLSPVDIIIILSVVGCQINISRPLKFLGVDGYYHHTILTNSVVCHQIDVSRTLNFLSVDGWGWNYYHHTIITNSVVCHQINASRTLNVDGSGWKPCFPP